MRYLMPILMLLILNGPIVSIPGPGLACLGGKLYYVSPDLWEPALVLDENREPVTCGEE